jgi:hypothetical protein
MLPIIPVVQLTYLYIMSTKEINSHRASVIEVDLLNVELNTVMVYRSESGAIYWRPIFNHERKNINDQICKALGVTDRHFHIVSNGPFLIEDPVRVIMEDDEHIWRLVDLLDAYISGTYVKGRFAITVAISTATVLKHSVQNAMLLGMEGYNVTPMMVDDVNRG